jgi:DNA-dependent protein kinase catalytic subunit
MRKVTKSRDVRDQHLGLLNVNKITILNSFHQQLNLFPKDLLKRAIKKKVQNAEQYIKIRNNFLKNYATLSLGSYILGVGDRHLDNFLFDCQYGTIIPIDFGYSFGFGVGLPIPELVPFRFTQNFENMTYPLGSTGIFRNAMIYSLKALKDNRHVIIDACEVFIRDPLMDWLKMAQHKEKQ